MAISGRPQRSEDEPKLDTDLWVGGTREAGELELAAGWDYGRSSACASRAARRLRMPGRWVRELVVRRKSFMGWRG